jgi:hypothetical protein
VPPATVPPPGSGLPSTPPPDLGLPSTPPPDFNLPDLNLPGPDQGPPFSSGLGDDLFGPGGSSGGLPKGLGGSGLAGIGALGGAGAGGGPLPAIGPALAPSESMTAALAQPTEATQRIGSTPGGNAIGGGAPGSTMMGSPYGAAPGGDPAGQTLSELLHEDSDILGPKPSAPPGVLRG